MAFLPQDPGTQLKLLVAILSVAAGALYFNFLHAPAGLELEELTDRVEHLETQNQVAQARVGDLQRLRDDMRDAERRLAALERLVPQRAEVPEIYEAIASETQTLNLRLLSIEPLTPTPADSAGTLMRQEWALVVEGGYHALGAFLTNVASFDRIVRPRVSQVVPTGRTAGGRQLIEATFILETFVLSSGDARTSTPSEPAAGETAGGLVGR